MDIKDSHTCNLLGLELLSEYYKADYNELKAYYKELAEDTEFLNALNERMDASRKFYAKGLFGKGKIDTVDWFGNQRIILYVLLRLLKPELAVETGCFYGGTTAFMLNAIRKNGNGRLVSIDLPATVMEEKNVHRHENVGNSEKLYGNLKTGFIIPDYLKERWDLIEDESMRAMRKIKETFTFFSHDSEHSRDYMREELTLAKSMMPVSSTLIADDIDWSNGFLEFCVNNRLYPLFLTDNGKNALKVRLGLVRLNHQFNGKKDVTG